MALLASLPEHRAPPRHRLLRACPPFPTRGAAAGPVRPDASPIGAVRLGPAGDRPPVGIAAVAADPGPLSPAVAVAGPPARRNLSSDARVVAHAGGEEANPVR